MDAVEKAIALTSAFEGSGGYANLTGSFDGMGISFGFLQWNLGRGTLQPLIKKMAALHPEDFKRACTVFIDCYNESRDVSGDLLKVCALKPAEAVKWAEARQDSGHRISEAYDHWRVVFKNLGNNPNLRKVQVEAARPYLKRAYDYFKKYGFKSERAFCLLFDICVQCGSITPMSAARYRLAVNKNTTEDLKLAALATAVAPQGGKWAKDVLSRKLAIAKGAGVVHGKPYHLERDFKVTLAPASFGGYFG